MASKSPLAILSLPLLLLLPICAAAFQSQGPVQLRRLPGRGHSPVVVRAEGEEGGGGPVEKLFGLFFGRKVEKPLGFDRITTETSPESFPAVTDRFAAPLRSDDKDVAIIRPLLAQTNIEFKPLKLVYDANKDGWSVTSFHKKVDNKGPALVLAKSKGGAIFGGYNPEGWEGVGDERRGIAAFLFTWPDGKIRGQPIKLRKVGGADYVVQDDPDIGIKFGYEDLVIKLTGGAANARTATSRLGLSYSNLPDGSRSLFTPAEAKAKEAQLVDLKVFVKQAGRYL